LKISPDGYCKGTTINSVAGAENCEILVYDGCAGVLQTRCAFGLCPIRRATSYRASSFPAFFRTAFVAEHLQATPLASALQAVRVRSCVQWTRRRPNSFAYENLRQDSQHELSRQDISRADRH
jgi:hypothetical protein